MSNPPRRCGGAGRDYAEIRKALFDSQICALNELDTSSRPAYDGQHVRWKSAIYPSGYKMTSDFGAENNDDLANGEWAVTFNDGSVKGTALCLSASGTTNQSGTPDTNASGANCWCRADMYLPNTGDQCRVSSPTLVFNYAYDTPTNCGGGCASRCAKRTRDTTSFQNALFGK